MSEMLNKNEAEQKSTLMNENTPKKSTLFKSEPSGNEDKTAVKKTNNTNGYACVWVILQYFTKIDNI